jgi:hypothetical protein
MSNRTWQLHLGYDFNISLEKMDSQCDGHIEKGPTKWLVDKKQFFIGFQFSI